MSAAPLIYLIAGEPSGDLLGARLIDALRRTSTPRIEVAGIGGERMAQAGLSPLFPMGDIALMGFAEILPHARRLLARIRQTVEDIIARAPEVVVTIDSPGFNFRVAAALRARNFKGKLVHYVAPTVWAYKPQRARVTAQLYDCLLTLLPFEAPYFEAEGLTTHFIGHPVVCESPQAGSGSAFRAHHGIASDVPLLALLPGSRDGELKRHLPVFRAVAERLSAQFPGLALTLPTTAALAPSLAEQTADWNPRPIIVTDDAEKRDALAASTVALVKSGTITLEVALAGVPMVVTYRVHPLSAWLLRRMIRVPYVTLINLLLDAPVIPELLQERCTPEALAGALETLLRDPQARAAQQNAAARAFALLGRDEPEAPSDKAAAIVRKFLY